MHIPIHSSSIISLLYVQRVHILMASIGPASPQGCILHSYRISEADAEYLVYYDCEVSGTLRTGEIVKDNELELA